MTILVTAPNCNGGKNSVAESNTTKAIRLYQICQHQCRPAIYYKYVVDISRLTHYVFYDKTKRWTNKRTLLYMYSRAGTENSTTYPYETGGHYYIHRSCDIKCHHIPIHHTLSVNVYAPEGTVKLSKYNIYKN